jgi:hypothetical protein
MRIYILLLGLPAHAEPALEKRLADGLPIVRVVPVAGASAPAVWIDQLIDAPMPKITALISACDRYVGLMPRVYKSLLRKAGAPNHVCELFIDMPFPFSDVRSLITFQGSVSATRVELRYEQTEGDYNYHRGRWLLRPRGNKTWVHYELHFDLAKPLPTWLVTSSTKTSLKKTLAAIAARVAVR